MLRIASYNRGRGARALARALGVRVWSEDSPGTRVPPAYLINWGRSSLETRWFGEGTVILNKPDKVRQVQDKLSFSRVMEREGVPSPEFTTDIDLARAWTIDGTVVCRTLLRASSGRGIVLATNPEEVVRAPLYTKYKKKRDEYRVHYFRHFDGTIRQVDCQQKRRRRDVEDADFKIRNHSRGWIYAREEVNPPQEVTQAARAAFDASGLNFGAVDVIYNQYHNRAYVLEINTAPGLEGSTLITYRDNFLGMVL